MCIIAAKPKDTVIDIKTLKNCWESNPDGAGIAVAIDGRVEIVKGLMTWEQFLEVYEDPELWRDYSMVLHFRIRTHGAADEDNTHPFEVIPDKLAFAHNGILPGMRVTTRPELSDTQVFNRYILQQLPHNFLENDAIRRLIDGLLGYSNKLAFLDYRGRITIFNHEQGCKRDDGVWFSNTDYLYAGGWSARRDMGRSPWSGLHDTSRATAGTHVAYDDVEAEDEKLNSYWQDYYCFDCAYGWEEEELGTNYIPPCPLCGEIINVDYADFCFDRETGEVANAD